ncbi:MAG: hypothetical protein EHM70_08520 [Chloroflexota bacterium]|nr:MAG: hypothetical protein EHM70_08520 [Chloroflexota bacterium]
MTTSLIDADSLLAFDIGAVTTRAMLFDVVDGRYRFLAAGSSPTTAGAPFGDIGEGIRRALDQLQEVTGRQLVGSNEAVIIPCGHDGSGVDRCVATISVGAPLKVVALGLLEDVSADSAQRLATTTYAQVVDRFSLNDRRKASSRLDSILRLRPNVIIVAGGTEGGASQSVLSQLEAVGLACYLLPDDQRPEVLFAGNHALAKDVETALGGLAHLLVAPNIRPSLEVEQLAPAQGQLAQIYRRVRERQIPGVHELNTWTNENTLPTATAFGRMIRFLSRVYDPAKGVLGIDIGASAATLAASFSGDLTIAVHSDLGLGENIPNILRYCRLEDISRWFTVEVPEGYVRNYLHNKAAHPAMIPATVEDLAIEQGVARQTMQATVKRMAGKFPPKAARSSPVLLPWFEPVVASGSVFSNAPSRGQSLLMLLDGLQPTGISTFVLDQNKLLPALGAASSVNTTLPVQVLESSNFLNLSTVISVTGQAQFGAPALRVKVTYEAGNQSTVNVKYGALEVIPLPAGQSATLHLQPLNRMDVGMGGPGRGGNVRVVGGAFGVVIDARGRPLRLPADPGKRREIIKKWIWTLGG